MGGTMIASFALAFFASGAAGDAFAKASAFVIGPGFAPFRAAARILCVSTGSAFAAAVSFFGAAFAAGAAAGLAGDFSFGWAGAAASPDFPARAIASI